MGFLAPWYLMLGAAVAIPFAVHLLRRRAGRRVDFPAARYLVRAEREHSRQLRVRNLLLMVLRVVTVLLIALAAARPLSGAWGALFGGGHAPTAVALVLDNSLSTSVIENGHPVLERLKAVARRAVQQAGSGDRVWLVTADDQVRGGNARTMAEAIDHVTSLAGAGDVRQAVSVAVSLIRRSGMPNGVVAIVTDGQRSTWDNAARASADISAGNARLVVYTLSTNPPANHAVTDVVVRPAHWTPRGEIAATVMGGGRGTNDSMPYRITLAGRTLARGVVADGEISVHAAPSERGWLAGTVELDPDELRGDDIRYFAVVVANPPGVTVDSSVGPFVRGAIDALVAGGEATVATAGPRLTITSADQVTTLPAVIVAPLDPVRIGAANRALARAGIPWSYGALQHGDGAVDSVTGTPPLATTQAWFPLVARAGANADTLARFSATGAPWAVAGPGYVLLASPLDPRATTLPLRAGFVPWMADVLTQHVVGGMGEGDRGVLSAAPGATVPRPDWAREMEAPDGTRRAIAGATLRAPAQPGVYFLHRAGGERIGALVVNGEARESDLARLTPAELGRLLRGRRVTVTASSGRWAAAVLNASAGRSLAVPLLIVALVLLVVETIILRRGTSSSSRHAGRSARIHAADQHPSRAA